MFLSWDRLWGRVRWEWEGGWNVVQVAAGRRLLEAAISGWAVRVAKRCIIDGWDEFMIPSAAVGYSLVFLQ